VHESNNAGNAKQPDRACANRPGAACCLEAGREGSIARRRFHPLRLVLSHTAALRDPLRPTPAAAGDGGTPDRGSWRV